MKVLVTVGATEEPIDPVRYITNASSGRMGRAIIEEAIKRHHTVTVVAATTKVSMPEKAKIYNVRTAREMTSKTIEELLNDYSIFISTAAIADYTPVYSERKIRSGRKEQILKLKPNPKLTGIVKKKFKETYVVAFKAEYDVSLKELMRAAYTKVRGENLDLAVGNDVKKNRMGGGVNEVTIVTRAGEYATVPRGNKEEIAEKIWDIIEEDFRKTQ